MNRSDLNRQAASMGLTIDQRWSDSRLKEEIAKKGVQSLAANPVQGERFADNEVPVDDTDEFKKNAEMDKIRQEVKASEKLFPVKLLKNYRPVSVEAQIQDIDGTYRPMSEEESMKVPAGTSIALPVEEAQGIVAKKIAERNDPIA